jgi:putative restriction endonuclease
MTPDEIRDRFRSLTVWKRGGERAPHKPLLALYAIGRVLRGEPRMAPYAEFDKDLAKLLAEFGPPRRTVRTEYPFWRLRNDEVWELSNTENVGESRSADARKSDLLAHDVRGGFPPEVQERGPDEESNGPALCTLHHKLFDRGVFTLSDTLNVVVSERASGTRGFQE